MNLRSRMRVLAVGAAAAVALSTTGAPAATASSTSSAALSCVTTIGTPTFRGVTVSSYAEIKCNQTVTHISAMVFLLRDGTLLGSRRITKFQLTSAYQYISAPCVSGNYYVRANLAANMHGGFPEFTDNLLSPTVSITC